VDLVLCGHDHDYERSFPVGGADTDAGREVATGAAVNTMRPRPVTTTDSGVFDTSQGTVHLILGCGGTDAPLDADGTGSPAAPPQPGAPTPGHPGVEAFPLGPPRPAAWSFGTGRTGSRARLPGHPSHVGIDIAS